ncbi:MAG: ABC transporter substrate-binding protein [Desulfobacteraceae bacterium]|nr:ABC transporter substrate-binding protein [Desulfobacteraceae bacterium]
MQISFFLTTRPGSRFPVVCTRFLFGILAAVWIAGCAPKVVIQPTEPPPAARSQEVFETGERLFLAGNFRQALAAYQDYLRMAPEGKLADAARMKSGASLEALGRPDEARSQYRGLLQKHPDSPFAEEAQVALLSTYLNQGLLEELIAEGAALETDTLSPSARARVHRIMADAYWLLGNPEEAARNYAKSYRALSGEAAEEVMRRLKEALALLTPEAMERLLQTVEEDDVRQLLQDTARPLVFSHFQFGCILPLSGKFESVGRKALRGIEMAVSQYGKRNFAPGLKVVVRDSRSDPEQAAQAVRELAEEHHVSAIIGSLATAESVAAECQRLGIPVVTFSQKDGIPQIGDFVFRNFITPKMQVQALVGFSTQTLGVDGFAILYPDEKYGRLFMNLFWDEVASRGGKIVGVESYVSGQTDFSDVIKKLVGLFYPLTSEMEGQSGLDGTEEDPTLFSPTQTGGVTPAEALAGAQRPIVDFHGLFIPDSPKTAGLIIPQLAFHDVQNTYLLGTNLWHSASFIEMTREHGRSAVIPTGFFAHAESEDVRRFTGVFTDTFGEDPGFIEAVAFDTAMMFFQAAATPGVQSRADLRDALLLLSPFAGVTGPTTFTQDGECSKPIRLLRVMGGRFVEIPFQP